MRLRFGDCFNAVIAAFLHYYAWIVKSSILLSVKKQCKQQRMGNKKVFSTRIDEDRIKELKHLAVDSDKSLGALLEEAIQDLLRKYKEKPEK